MTLLSRSKTQPLKVKQQGFSLLEILVAFSILALGLGVLFQIYSRGANATALSRGYNNALIVAQSQLAAVDENEKITIGSKSGNTENNIQWHRTITPFVTEKESGFRKRYQLVNVEVSVRWESLGRPHNFSLKSMRMMGIK